MAYGKASAGPSNEVKKLQEEITHEVTTDAESLATDVFGKLGNMPDVQRVSDQELDARYRQAYTTQDRPWLIQEAQRDPEQFVTVARRIGVQLPEEIGQGAPSTPSPAAAPAQPPSPPPVAAPAPLPLPVAPPAVPLPTPGVSLGAVGQPAQPVPLTAPAVTQGM